MSYTKVHESWEDYPDITTPVTAAALEQIEQGIANAATTADAAIAKSIVDAKGDLIVATAADVVARKAVGSNDQALFAKSSESDGVKWLFPPGYEYAVTSITASVSVSATSEASPESIVTASSVVYDGSTPIIIEFFCPRVTLPSVANIGIVFALCDTGVEVCRIGVLLNNAEASGNLNSPVFLKHRFTPSNGSHTYSVRAHMSASGTATITAGAGSGGSGVSPPTFMRQIKA